jgi:hypothetical protein
MWLTQLGIEPTIYHTRDKHANHYITDVVEEKKNMLLFVKRIMQSQEQWIVINGNNSVFLPVS